MPDRFEASSESSDGFPRFPDALDEGRGISPWTVVFGVLIVAVLGLGIFLVAMVALQPDAETAPKSRRPVIASETMPDGTILTLESVTYGRSHTFTFNRESRTGGFWPTSHVRTESCSHATSKDMTVVWFTRSHPTTGAALDFVWWLRCAAVDEHGCEIDNVDIGRNAYERFGGSGMSGATGTFSPLTGGPYQMIVAHFAVPPLRHKGKTFKLRVYNTRNVKVAEFDVPDPSPAGGHYPEWTPEELPITKSDGDVAVTLTDLTAQSSEYTRTSNGISTTQTRVRLNTQMTVAQNGEPTNLWTSSTYRVTDALGNESSVWDCDLCPMESAWKLRVQVWRSDQAEFDASEVWSLSELPVPRNQQIGYVNQSHAWRGTRLELVALGGPGKVSYLGLLPGRRGSYSSNGIARFGQGNDRKSVRYQLRVQNGQTDVDSEVPHLLVQASGLSEDQRVALHLSDEQERAISVDGPRHVMSGLELWFLNVPPEVEKLHGELIVHECRTFEFLVKPPKIVPAPSTRSTRKPRSPAQRQASARSAIEAGERAVAAGPNVAEALNNLAWAYAIAPEELRNAGRAVALAEKAVDLEPRNQNYINTLGVAYYRAGLVDKAIATLRTNAGNRTDVIACFDLYPLAMALFQSGDLKTAKQTYDRAREQHARSEAGLSSTHWNELFELRNEAATLFLGESPQDAFDNANRLARSGKWQQAGDLFLKALDVAPEDHWSWYRSGALQAYLGHSDTYRDHCRSMLQRFGDTQDPFIAERTGKLCYLLPDAIPNDKRPGQLIERAVGQRSNVPWFQLASAIHQYRAGQFPEALEQLQTAESQAEDTLIYCRVMIDLFRAMSQHQLGQTDAARNTLKRALDRLNASAPKPEAETVDYGSGWHDRLMCEVIRREAEKLLRETPAD